MHLTSLQMALFLKRQLDRPDLLMYEINSKLGDILDTMPIIDPLAIDSPVVKVHSSDQIFELKVSWKRVDFFVYPKEQDGLCPLESFNAYRDQFDRFASFLDNHLELVRVGFIAKVFYPCDSSIQNLYNRYHINSSPDQCIDFYLRTNKLQKIDGFKINNIQIVQANEQTKGILLEFDSNNIENEHKLISKTIITKVIDSVSQKLNDAANF